MILKEKIAAVRRENPSYPRSLLTGIGGDGPSEFWAAAYSFKYAANEDLMSMGVIPCEPNHISALG